MTTQDEPKKRAPGGGRKVEVVDGERHNIYVSGPDWRDASALFEAEGSNVSAEIRDFLAGAAKQYRAIQRRKQKKRDEQQQQQ